ncbi:unnamed protein product, partial [Closterium sp. NIES-53]
CAALPASALCMRTLLPTRALPARTLPALPERFAHLRAACTHIAGPVRALFPPARCPDPQTRCPPAACALPARTPRAPCLLPARPHCCALLLLSLLQLLLLHALLLLLSVRRPLLHALLLLLSALLPLLHALLLLLSTVLPCLAATSAALLPPLPLLLLAAATAALLACAAQRCPTLPGRLQRCPAAATGGVEAPSGVEATTLGACDSASTGAEPEEALHSFTLNSGVSCCFFRDSTTVTPLTVPVPVTLTYPIGGPVIAWGSTILPCPAVSTGNLTGLHLPSFAKNLVATSVLQDQWVIVTQPRGELVAICTDLRTGEHLATFTRTPGSGLYILTTESVLVAESGQVAASVEAVASCSCCLLTHQTLLWHHHLGHPSLPRHRGMHSRLLLSGLARSLPLLHSSSVDPPHGRVGSSPSPWTGRRALLLADDCTRYTTVFPLQSKAEVRSVLIRWIRAVRRQLRARFQQDLPFLRLHADRGGEFSSSLLEEF